MTRVSRLFGLVACILAAEAHAEIGAVVMTTSPSESSLHELFTNRVNPNPDTYDDVIMNDRRRLGNFLRAFSGVEQRLHHIVEFVSIPRPQIENDILVEYGQELEQLSKTNENRKALGPFFVVCKFFCTKDARIWQLAKKYIETSYDYPVDTYLWGAHDALECIGMVRTTGVAAYLARAVTVDYWRELIGPNCGERYSKDDILFLRHHALRGILNLPCDESIPIFEKLLRELPEDDQVRKGVRRYLDEAWRRKKNELPVDKYLLRDRKSVV